MDKQADTTIILGGDTRAVGTRSELDFQRKVRD